MKAISKLKDDARKHELKEEWDKAVHLYLQVLRVGEEGEGEVDLPLFNRVGDLYVRLGRPDQAVTYYEQAADRYAEAGLYNNAIALCNKALRYDSDQPELLRKLGQFSASQGFLTDARRYFLQFAEKKFAVGAVDEALTALEDFANVADDPEIREMLGRQLHAHGRNDEAVAELRKAHAGYVSGGASDRAEAVLETMRGIDPAAAEQSPAAPAAPPQDEQASADTGLSDFAFGTEAASDEDVALPTLDFGSAEDGLDTAQLGDAAPDGSLLDLPGFGEEDAAGEDTGFGMLEGLESTSLDFGAVAADLAVPDFGLEFERDETSFDQPASDDAPSEEPEAASLGFPGLDEDAAELDLGGMHDADDDGGDLGVFELPTLTDDDDDAAPGFALPTLDDDEAEPAFDLPTLDDSDAPVFELPTFDEEGGDDDEDDAASAFELPVFGDADDDEGDAATVGLQDDDAGGEAGDFEFSLPSLDAPSEDGGDPETALNVGSELPSLESDAELSEHSVTETAESDDLDETFADADDWASDVAAALNEGLEESGPELEWPSADAPAVGLPEDAADDVADVGVEEVDITAESESAADAQAEMERGWTPDELLGDEPSTAAAAAEEPAPPPERAAAADAGFVDLGALLAEDGPESTRFRVQETAPTGDEDRDFAELLSQFKAKVSEHLPAEDAAAHYDLGLAFKEMGLIDEAISEFQIAMRAGHMRLKVYEELGDCFLQKQQFNIAEKVLRRGLEVKYDDELELLGVYYYLGRAYEGMGQRDQARDAYERVLGLDINFQDVSERLARL